MTDRSAELSVQADVWPEIRSQIPAAIGLAIATMKELAHDLDADTDVVERMETKFRAGEREHQRDWLQMDEAHLRHDEISAEAYDLVLYHAMLLARFGEPAA